MGMRKQGSGSRIKNRRGSININSILIPVATIGGLIIGLGLNQVSKGKNIAPAELIKPVKSANASPGASPQKESPAVRPLPEKTRTNSAPAVSSKAIDAEKSIQRLKDYMKNTEEKSAFLKEKIELLNDLLNSKGKELSKLGTDNAILKENLNKTIELQNKIKSDFETTINSLNAKLIQKDADIASLNTAKADLEKQLVDLNNKTSALSADYATLQGKSVLWEQEKLVIESRLSRIREDLDRQEAVNEALNKNLSELTLKIADKDKERMDIGKQLEQLSAAKSSVESELTQLKAVKADNDNSIKQLNNRINELSALYEEAKKSVFEMSGLLAKKEQAINEEQNDVAALKESLTKSDGGKTLLLASLDEKGKTVRELNLALSSMESRMAILQKDLAAERERQAKIVQQLVEAVSLNSNLKTKLKNIYIELELIRAEKNRE